MPSVGETQKQTEPQLLGIQASFQKMKMRNNELEEENARLRELVANSGGAVMPSASSEELDFYVRRVQQLEAELEAMSNAQGGNRRVVFHSEQCLDGASLYGYPSHVEQYRPIVVSDAMAPRAYIAPAPAPRPKPVTAPAVRGTFGPPDRRDFRDQPQRRGPGVGFASRIRRAEAVSRSNHGDEKVTYV